MAIPSGGGTEVLKNNIIQHGGTSEGTLITGEANHIYTVLSIIAFNDAASAQDLNIYINKQAAGTNFYLMAGSGSSVPSKTTFVWNDKFVLYTTDRLHVTSGSGSDFEIIVSYIEQDWS